MGMTHIRVGFSRGLRGHKRGFRLLVDTGSFCSILPARVLRDLGVQPEWSDEFEMANGEGMTRLVGRAYVHYGRRSAETFVIFGEGRDEPLLGSYALEGLGLEVDPRSKRVRHRRKTLMVSLSPA